MHSTSMLGDPCRIFVVQLVQKKTRMVWLYLGVKDMFSRFDRIPVHD